MDFQTRYITNDIKLSEYEGKLFKTEVLFEHHMLVWFISGETKVIMADATHIFGEGDIFLIPKNQVATVINYPKDGRPHKTAVMHITKERLGIFYTKHKAVVSDRPLRSTMPTGRQVYKFNDHPLLKGCLASLLHYFELQEDLPSDIADIKIEEAISILRSIDKNVDGLFSDFNDPGKIDIVTFMERHYMFNMTMDKFGYLTGRSEATFRRDFKKAFNETPQKWLTGKRLGLAHYEIAEKQRKPIDIYLEVGFENLSHFSYAFKKQFGYSPGEISNLS
jgi:AraC-like DNA-binding protein